MKANILDINGKTAKTIELPDCFSHEIREDIIAKVLESKKRTQPYAPSLVAGKQHSASGVVQHRRHVWKTHYGHGISRIPRKVMSVKGNRFNWVGAEVSSTRGGRRAHPPKVISMINPLKINKKEMTLALISALSATANEKKVKEKYARLNDKKLANIPLVVESKITSLKTKELLSSIKKILGENMFEVALQKKAVRSGKGKLRGRKYKKNAGLLLVTGKEEKLKTNAFDVKNVGRLSVVDLAKGGSGRLTLYTENAIKNLGEKFK
jgi:large subunit ribosomal protein L4e